MATRIKSFGLTVAVVALLGGRAQAQQAQQFDDEPYAAGTPYDLPAEAADDQYTVPEPYGPPPIPPDVEAQPVAGPGGSYCYVGAHPVDTRVAAGGAWDESAGQHVHFYPPFDQRLFTLRNGCYYFVGDPSDFGYGGQVYSYYGAHPVLDDYGGGWCFMIGGHGHAWQPWSTSFVVMGAWNYWNGPYDQYFRAYWPYYSYYYRSYYPRYYGGGRFARGRNMYVAPRIDRVPTPGRGWRASPPMAGGYRGRQGEPARGEVGRDNSWRGDNGWRGGPPGRMTPAPAPTPAPSPPITRYGSGISGRSSAPNVWQGGGTPAASGGWRGGASTAPPPPPPPATRMPSTPVPSGAYKSGGSPGHVGGARGGWRH